MKVLSIAVLNIIPVFAERTNVHAHIFAAPTSLSGILKTLPRAGK